MSNALVESEIPIDARRPRQVLVVEDDPAIRHAVSSTLILSGYEVVEADTGLAAMKLLSDRQFDVIVLDMMLPGLSGMDILRELRGSISTPIIAVTARSLLENRVEGLNLGADVLTGNQRQGSHGEAHRLSLRSIHLTAKTELPLRVTR